MANFDTLKTAITEVVKTNGNNEITGALLQDTLLAMVDSLGTGYQFKGGAVPSTEPGTPDQKVAYFAGPGTYPNFGAVTIPDGYVGIFYGSGSTWNVATAKTSPFTAVTVASDIIQLMDGTTPVYPRTRAEAVFFGNDQTDTLDEKVEEIEGNISQLGQSLSISLQSGQYVGGTTIGTSTIPDISPSTAFVCLKLSVRSGDKFIISGRGGESIRLFYIYGEDGKLLRCADANSDFNSFVLEILENEFTLIINLRSSYPNHFAYYRPGDAILKNYNTIAGMILQIATLSQKTQTIQNDLANAIGFSLTRGAYAGGTTIGTSTIPTMTATDSYDCVKIEGKPGDKIQVRGVGGTSYRLWYVYDTNGVLTRVAASGANTLNNPVIITLADTEKYVLCNIIVANGGDVFALGLPSQLANINKHIDNIDNSVLDNRSQINKLYDLLLDAITQTNNITWTENKYIKVDGTTIYISTTTANNKVGYIDLTNEVGVKLRSSVKSGGSYTKYGYCFLDSSNTVLASSGEISASDNYQSGDVILSVPSGAVKLYISWDNTITTQSIYPYIIGLSMRVSDGEGDSDVNIENIGIQIYDKVKYNNHDYSYTRFSYAIAAAGNPNYELPTPAFIRTATDNSAVARYLQIADNSTFLNPTTIQLDLVSDSYTIYNLEPNRIYYYRVYKDNNTLSLLNSGKFNTSGKVRQLKIDAQNFATAWISNVRDAGGWDAEHNQKIRYGCLIRGYELNHFNEGVETVYISETGKQQLIGLGIGAELDLRTNNEAGNITQSVIGSGVDYYRITLDLWFYRLNIYNTVTDKAQNEAAAIRKVLEWLEAGKGVYIHCAGGCDRTGALLAMIEGLCGVNENDINHDYELSNRDRSKEYYHITGNTDPATNKYDGDFKFAMEYIKGLIEYNNHIYVYYRNNYYDAEATVVDFTPVPLTDATLIANLAANNYGSLQERFERLLVGVGGLTQNEVQRLRTVLLS